MENIHPSSVRSSVSVSRLVRAEEKNKSFSYRHRQRAGNLKNIWYKKHFIDCVCMVSSYVVHFYCEGHYSEFFFESIILKKCYLRGGEPCSQRASTENA